MTRELWRVEGRHWPARREYPNQDAGVDAFYSELNLLHRQPPGLDRTQWAKGLVLYSCVPILWVEVTEDGTLQQCFPGVHLSGRDNDGGAADDCCADGEQANEQAGVVSS